MAEEAKNGLSEEQKTYDRLIKPHAGLFLLADLLIYPIIFALTWYVITGQGLSAAAIGTILLLFGLTYTLVTGHSPGGIYIRGSPTGKRSLARSLMWFTGMFFIVIIATAVLLSGQITNIIAALCMLGFFALGWIARTTKKHQRILGVIAGALLLPPVAVVALQVENVYIRMGVILLATLWACFVLLGAYNLIMGKPVLAETMR
jgi:hypothetical protein